MFRAALQTGISVLFITGFLSLCIEAEANDPPQILAFSKTQGFRHGSISNALAALQTLGDEHGFTVVSTEDAGAFTQANPRGRVNVLLTIDETSYNGGSMGGDHPLAWYHEFDGGRSWYTAMGHTNASYL